MRRWWRAAWASPAFPAPGTVRVDYAAQTLTAMGRTFNKGDIITIDGAAGQVMEGAVPMLPARTFRRFRGADGLGRRPSAA